MSGARAVGLLATGLAIAALAAKPALAECGLKQAASLDARIDEHGVSVPIKVDDKDFWLRIDTGAPISLIAQASADALKMPARSLPSGMLMDGTGHSLTKAAIAHTLQLGAMTARDVTFIVAPSTSEDGSLGADFLTAYDVEFDPAHKKVNWFMQDHCKGQVVYWSQDFVAVPFALDYSKHIVFPIVLDGQTLQAMLDTGSSATNLHGRAARSRFGLGPEMDATPSEGEETAASGKGLSFRRHRFSKMEIGGVEFHNTEIQILADEAVRRHIPDKGELAATPVPEADKNLDVSIVLGMHHLGRLRLYIAYAERMLYITAADAQ